MSVCGGRARCSTCRTLIVNGAENLSAQTEAEAHLLGKLNAGPDVRLACQARVRGDVAIRPLIQPQSSVNAPRSADPLGWGVEREIAVLFLDIRGFSRISEKSLPYDVVFILNSLFGEVGSGIEASNGYIDKFMGDGLMALFGLGSKSWGSKPRRHSRGHCRPAGDAKRQPHADATPQRAPADRHRHRHRHGRDRTDRQDGGPDIAVTADGDRRHREHRGPAGSRPPRNSIAASWSRRARWRGRASSRTRPRACAAP